MPVKCTNESPSCGDADGTATIYGIDMTEEIVPPSNPIAKSDKFAAPAGVTCFLMVTSVDGLPNPHNVAAIVVVRELWGKGAATVTNGPTPGVYGVTKINIADA